MYRKIARGYSKTRQRTVDYMETPEVESRAQWTKQIICCSVPEIGDRGHWPEMDIEEKDIICVASLSENPENLKLGCHCCHCHIPTKM